MDSFSLSYDWFPPYCLNSAPSSHFWPLGVANSPHLKDFLNLEHIRFCVLPFCFDTELVITNTRFINDFPFSFQVSKEFLCGYFMSWERFLDPNQYRTHYMGLPKSHNFWEIFPHHLLCYHTKRFRGNKTSLFVAVKGVKGLWVIRLGVLSWIWPCDLDVTQQ